MVLGEEDDNENEPPATDFVWAVDPVDGTTNYVNGMPVHAVSVAVLYRGAPVAAAVWVPWPSRSGSCLFHAYRDGGAWRDNERINVRPAADNGQPVAGRLVGVPFGMSYHVRNRQSPCFRYAVTRARSVAPPMRSAWWLPGWRSSRSRVPQRSGISPPDPSW